MVLVGSRWFSIFLSGSCCFHRFSVVLSGCCLFSVVLYGCHGLSVVLVGSQGSRRFSMVLSGSRRLSMFLLRASCWFS